MSEALKEQAQEYHAHLIGCYESTGFRIFWEHFMRESERVKHWAAAIPDGMNSDAVAQELRFRQGFLSGVLAIQHIKQDLEVALANGTIPWMNEMLQKVHEGNEA